LQVSQKITPTFAGEIQLAGWSESHTSGCKVTFWLSSSDELEAFRALTVRKGNTAGHRFMAALVEIGDDERPVELEPKAPRTQMGDACYRTVMWCQEPTFWAFLAYANLLDYPPKDSREAADLVREMCKVGSRKELDTNNEANKAWHRLIRKPYSEYYLKTI
jgi:hypothetical protein